jgi:hypothetical protein
MTAVAEIATLVAAVVAVMALAVAVLAWQHPKDPEGLRRRPASSPPAALAERLQLRNADACLK